MQIIIEGIDRCGKTTLANELSKVLNLDIYPRKTDVEYDKLECGNVFNDYLKLFSNANLKSYIFDRAYYSEYVYGVLDRNYNIAASKIYVSAIEQMLALHKNPIVILCLSNNIAESSAQHGKDLKKYNDLFLELYYNISPLIMCLKIDSEQSKAMCIKHIKSRLNGELNEK